MKDAVCMHSVLTAGLILRIFIRKYSNRPKKLVNTTKVGLHKNIYL